MTKAIVENKKRFKIKTDSGYSDFVGVLKTKHKKQQKMLKLIINNGITLKVTENHQVFYDLELSKSAIEFKIGDRIVTDKGIHNVVSISYCEPTNTVYDILHVFKNNRHYVKGNKIEENSILIKQCLFVDELAFVNRAEEFYEAVYPTISSGNNTKVIITSTPSGLNFFYKMWTDAENCRSDYIAYDVKWYEHPDRDQNWYDSMCKNMNKKSINQELHCVSGDTKITINGREMSIEDLHKKYLNYKDDRTLINGIAYKQLQKVIKV